MAVHNGIIENHAELREHLQKQGYTFVSETDTEVIPHLIDFYRRTSDSFEEAFERALNQLRGAYALGVMTSEETRRTVRCATIQPIWCSAWAAACASSPATPRPSWTIPGR